MSGRSPHYGHRVRDLQYLFGNVHRHVVLGAGVPVAVRRESDFRVPGYLVDTSRSCRPCARRSSRRCSSERCRRRPLRTTGKARSLCGCPVLWTLANVGMPFGTATSAMALIAALRSSVFITVKSPPEPTAMKTVVAGGRPLVDDPLHVLVRGVYVERLVLFEYRRQRDDDAVHLPPLPSATSNHSVLLCVLFLL